MTAELLEGHWHGMLAVQRSVLLPGMCVLTQHKHNRLLSGGGHGGLCLMCGRVEGLGLHL